MCDVQQIMDNNFLNSSEEELADEVCRICYGGDDAEQLIKPCACSGSLAFVHPSCLNIWVENSGSPRCEICGQSYPHSVNFRWWNIWNDIWVKYVIRQEPIFIFLSALINVLSSVLFRPLFMINQLWEDILVFMFLMGCLMFLTITLALVRNLLRFLVWQLEANLTPRVLRHRDRRVQDIARELLNERCHPQASTTSEFNG